VSEFCLCCLRPLAFHLSLPLSDFGSLLGRFGSLLGRFVGGQH
jgi:hypothetical protein